MTKQLPSDIALLRKYDPNGESFEYLPFFGHKPKSPNQIDQSCLSNWYPAPFVHEGTRYENNEQFMMAKKAHAFDDKTALARILANPNPFQCKKLGREVRNFDPKVWDEIKFPIVLTGCVAKFSQNEMLREFLLSTIGKILVEASQYDRIWGIGLAVTDPKATIPVCWKGQNLLGFALMAARGRLYLLN